MLDAFTPNRSLDRQGRNTVLGVWVVVFALVWLDHPSVFLPTPAETWTALTDMWLYRNLASAIFASVQLNIEAIAIATVISLTLAYAGTIAFFRPIVVLAGALRFLSFAGLGFAFTLMTSTGHALKVSVLVFMVVVFFVVSMLDVVDQIPQEKYDLAKTLRMGPWETLFEVVIFGQLDQAFIVLRQTAAMSWMFIATAEGLSMSGGGIGTLLNTSNKSLARLPDVLALQLLVLVLGLGQDRLIGWLREQCCPWVKK